MAAFSYSALKLTSSGQSAKLGTSIRVSLREQFYTRFCVQPTYGAQEYQSPPSRDTISQLGLVEPRRFIYRDQ